MKGNRKVPGTFYTLKLKPNTVYYKVPFVNLFTTWGLQIQGGLEGSLGLIYRPHIKKSVATASVLLAYPCVEVTISGTDPWISVCGPKNNFFPA